MLLGYIIYQFYRKEILITFLGIAIKALGYAYNVSSPHIAMCIVFSVYSSFGGELTPGIVLSALTHLSFIRYTAVTFNLGLLQLSESYVGYKRISVSSICVYFPYLLIHNVGFSFIT